LINDVYILYSIWLDVHLIKTQWPFWPSLSNLTRCIGQISLCSQVDWSKNTCFKPLIKMDMSINKKKLISQFESFEKPRILVLFGYGAWTWDMYEHLWNLHGTWNIWTWRMNMYETWTWGMGIRYVWTCMKLEHGTFRHMAWVGGMYEHVWNLDMGHLNMGHGACLCDSCYKLMVMVGVWCQTCGVMFKWWTSTIFVLKLLKSCGDAGSMKEC
jgi:hypothetical protein